MSEIFIPMSNSSSSPSSPISPHSMVCDQYNQWSQVKINQLPCCTKYIPRTEWVGSVFPPRDASPQRVANQFPFWGLWRTQYSPPLPRVFYPADIQPQGWCNPQFYGTSGSAEMPILTPNWALTK